jgi:hypothetical protein
VCCLNRKSVLAHRDDRNAAIEVFQSNTLGHLTLELGSLSKACRE